MGDRNFLFSSDRALTIRRDVNTLEQLAILYYTAGRTMEALAVYDDIEKLNENSTETLVRHVRIYYT
jgi:hypothetical protein